MTKKISPEDRFKNEVLPWLDRWALQGSHPIRCDQSEGYRGLGVLGSRAGPAEALSFSNVAHEMGHALELLEHRPLSDVKRRFSKKSWGLTIRSFVVKGRFRK